MRRTTKYGVLLAVAVWGGALSAAAFAQTYYLPPQFQYGAENTFYYAGTNPAVFESEARLRTLPNRDRFAPYRGLRVFTDALPTLNAAVYGYTVADVANESNLRQPTYFSMRQLREAAIVLPDGTRIVPSTAGSGAMFAGGPAVVMPGVAQNRAAAKRPDEAGYIRVVMRGRQTPGIMGGTSREVSPPCPESKSRAVVPPASF